jgi:nicotinate-nucleotide pyrophosphorylase (carboxylating)
MKSHLETDVRRCIQHALEEDRVHEDITSIACLEESAQTEAYLLLKQRALIAGLPFLSWIFHCVDPSIQLHCHVQEGQECPPGTILAHITGPARALLSCERTALNLLQHASGIATLTNAFVRAVEGYPCDILDTRKTLPGLRHLQKYAVAVGGGKNHRFDLNERFLIKNNHLAHLKKHTEEPIKEAIQKARALYPNKAIEVEVESLEMLQASLEAKAEFILLDNMSLDLLAQAVCLAKGKAYLEASGGVNLTSARSIAKTGVDGISIGALTHSVSAIDISFRI